MTESYVQASLVAMLKLLSSATKDLETAMENISNATQDTGISRDSTEPRRTKPEGVYINGQKFVAANDC